MTDKLSNRLRRLLTATILGGNPNHPLAGWSILTILRHNTQNIDSPLTPDFLLQHFNMAYLEPNEAPLTNEVFKRILDRLVSANLIERSSHKVREQMHNGTRHINPNQSLSDWGNWPVVYEWHAESRRCAGTCDSKRQSN